MSIPAKQRPPFKERIKLSCGAAIAIAIGSHYRRYFLAELVDGADVFDIGCGNDSPYEFKALRPDIRYVGLDITDYQQEHDPTEYADEYLSIPSEGFLPAIQERPNQFDAVVSSHNLEHCQDQDGVLTAMARALRPGGRIYLAFPCAASLSLPSRENTLNFWDDDTHVRPPDYQRVLDMLAAEGVTIDFTAERYRPVVRVVYGILTEPICWARKKAGRGTWALWGFETIIWGTKA